MARWQGGARERLQAAALERFAEQGFDGTTVAEIAATAGLTERTFFRYFTDKREVLFQGQDDFERRFISAIDEAEDGADPMSTVGAALNRGGSFFQEERRTWSRARNAVIEADPGLRERELLKLSLLAVAMADALRERGVDGTVATLAAESGVTVFRVAFAKWVAEDETRPFPDLLTATVAELRDLVSPVLTG
ncbi:MAG TPA: TetR family transcriptional regulator [Pseudonocardiaceae bacterium]|nr:TetR family transcriptional regulator [Pseudonocardiaceae bacterium]